MEDHDEPVERISAVTLHTTRMAESVAFYEALGFRRLYGGGDDPFTSFRVGGGYLNLQADPARSGRFPVWGRVIFWVKDVDALYHRAVDGGLAPEAAPADAAWGERYFHIRDPDGHELSFARPIP
jgi:catechol 2,3-dioxygenase-like lactoylglutathione lyase family enzyme